MSANTTQVATPGKDRAHKTKIVMKNYILPLLAFAMLAVSCSQPVKHVLKEPRQEGKLYVKARFEKYPAATALVNAPIGSAAGDTVKLEQGAKLVILQVLD